VQEDGEDPNGPTDVVLRRLVDDGVFSEAEVARRSSLLGETQIVSANAPCFGHEIVFIMSEIFSRIEGSVDAILGSSATRCSLQENSVGSQSCAAIERWDVLTGARRIIGLVDDTGLGLDLSLGNILPYFDSRSLQGSNLYWIHPDGYLLRTNIDTGETDLISDLTDRFREGSRIRVDFNDSCGHILIVSPDHADAEIVSVSLATGVIARAVPVDVGILASHADQITYGFAVNPDSRCA
jgi:hypothetical protein